ncbi:class I SAM-dependent methyltransferase [Primorskyibacter sp. S87]|uniref:class I SAM-dependent methyltransferase n=1 Tax=Primorskyibacter sp. S87 TaxID=3415126 RepID=UPI003C7A4095
MNVQTTPANTPDLATVKTRQQAAWSTGNYPLVGVTLQITGERLAEAMDLHPDARVLDVAAGNGNATLAAARRFCNVVSTDYVGAWLKAGMARAEAERLEVAFREADAEDLPFEDGSFDAVTSTFGVMFTANQEAAASELTRVCRSGGRIGLINWTPESFVGQLFRTIGQHVPPPAGVRSPLEWGTEKRIEELFNSSSRAIEFNRKHFTFRFRSAEHWIELWRDAYGPMNKAFEAVGESGSAALEADLASLAREHSQDDTAMIVPSEYAEIIIHRS